MVLISAIKDLIEDLMRRKGDKEENESEVLVAQNGAFLSKQWQELRAGEVVKVMKD